MLLFLGSLAAGSLLWPAMAAAEAPGRIVVDSEFGSCETDITEDLSRELSVRSAAEVVSANARRQASPAAGEANGDGESQWIVSFADHEQKGCEISLYGADESVRFHLAHPDDPLEVAAIATRMAWIVDGLARATEIPEAEATIAPQGPGIWVDESPSTSLVAVEPEQPPAPDRRASLYHRRPGLWAFSADAVTGLTWLLGAQQTAMMARAQLVWQPWKILAFALAARLPLNALEWEAGGDQFAYRFGSLALAAHYTHRLGRRWGFFGGGGLRRSFSALTVVENEFNGRENNSPGDPGQGSEETPLADNPNRRAAEERRTIPTRDDDTLQSRLSPWAVLARGGGQFFFNPRLSLSLEATAAVSLGQRTAVDDQRQVMDLGRLDLDLLLGLQWRF